MRKVVLFFILFQISLINEGQIIADHTIVADFDKIPPYYIAEVKKMMVCFPGESHSEAYRVGMELMKASYPAYTSNVSTGEAFTDQYLRVNYGPSTGEADWFTWRAWPTPESPAKDAIKNLIAEYSSHGHPINVLGFGWCWDMEEGTSQSIAVDPVFGCHWYGRTDGGPEGTLCFGLDTEDYSITGNRVSMDTYLAATEDYIADCAVDGFETKVVFTTGPVQHSYERGYQGYLKHEYIRNYVKENSSRILFDYADILCYDDDGSPTTTTWNGNTFPLITNTNLGDESIGHIGVAGAIRLAKAQWWLLARLAGWDGVQVVPVEGITVTGEGGATVITTDNGTLQLSAAITPGDATEQTITWTIVNGTGQAIISATGLVTAMASGTVTAQATINDGSGVTGTMEITIFKSNIADQLVVIVNQNEMIFPLDESFLDCKISVYNLNGNLMTSRLVKSEISVFDVTGFHSGLYIAVLSNNLIRKVAKIIIH